MEELKLMDCLKWYSTFAFLAGSIVSFVDVVTDVLTLVEFYREDQKTWFGVGLLFLVLPCFAFSLLYSMPRLDELATSSYIKCCTKVLLCGFNPFSVALARLRAFIFCLRNFKKLWEGQKIESANEDTDEEKDINERLYHCALASLFEAVLESAPQFILQLYAISVQEHPVEIIQMISLPVSLLSLTWTFTTADELLQKGETIYVLTIKHKILIFLTHLILLSSRLFAVGYFVVSYKWWVIVVLTLHSIVIALFEVSWIYGKCVVDQGAVLIAVLFFFLHWLRDDWSVKIQDDDNENKRKKAKRLQLFSNVLFVVENIAMILFFYFSPFPNTWYSLPVTVCVCSFSVLGAVIRVTHFRLLMNKNNGYTVNPMLDLAGEEWKCIDYKWTVNGFVNLVFNGPPWAQLMTNNQGVSGREKRFSKDKLSKLLKEILRTEHKIC